MSIRGLEKAPFPSFAQHNAETCEYPQGHPELCANYDRESSDLALRSADLQKELKAAETPRAAARVHFEQLMTRLRTASWPESLTVEKDRLIGCTSLNGSKDAEACLVAAQKEGTRPSRLTCSTQCVTFPAGAHQEHASPVRDAGWSPPSVEPNRFHITLFGPTARTPGHTKGARMSTAQGVGAPPPQSDVRPLPPHPNLEFERKEAKALLKQFLSGDEIAVQRLRAASDSAQGAEPKAQLADAQFAIAREYGFANWPRLVERTSTDRWNLHEKSQRDMSTYRPAHYEDDVRRTLAAHQSRRWWMAPSAAAYLPRCYGKSDEEIFDTPLTEAEIRHLVARREMFSNWDALLAAANRTPTRDESALFTETPFGRAQAAIVEEDLAALQAIIAEHSELLRPATDGSMRAMNGVPRKASIIFQCVAS